MPSHKNFNKSVSTSWKERKRTGGIRRKCLREYTKLKNSCASIETDFHTKSRPGPSVSKINDVKEDSVYNFSSQSQIVEENYDFAFQSQIEDENSRPGPSVSKINDVKEDSVYNFSSQSQIVDKNYDFAFQSQIEEENCNKNIEDSNSSCSDLEEASEFNKNSDFRNNLRKWAVNKNISQEAVKDLLNVINQRFPGILPVDPRTLLQTPRHITIKEIEGGEYWYNGLTKSLYNILNIWLDFPSTINLNFNFDGLPIFKSSKKEFWPVLCNIHEKTDIEPLIVGIYYGSGKPKRLEEYLEDFVTEMETLLENGINIVKEGEEKTVTVKIRCFICDSPARAFIKGVCNFNAKHGCLKCTTVGDYSHKSHTVVFSNSSCPKRTNEDFRQRKYGQHHKTDTPLLRLPIDMIEDFPVSDSLHLIDLGVMKRLLVGWRDGNFEKLLTKWRALDTQKVTDFLRGCKLPAEIHRSARGLDELLHWKASEFRSFLYYLSIIILPEVMSNEPYEHFLLLFCAITICSSEKYSSLLELSKELLLHFVENFKTFYGDYITSNIHNLVHVTDEVRKFGPLNTFNSYPFENKLHIIKKMLRKGNKPLIQVAKRLAESDKDNYSKDINENGSKTKYPIITKSRHHNIVKFESFKISHKTQDKYFITTERDIIEVKEITEKSIKGYKIENLSDVFQTPIKSSYLKIFKASIPDGNRTVVDIHFDKISNKLVVNSYKNNLYFIPLLHTLKE